MVSIRAIGIGRTMQARLEASAGATVAAGTPAPASGTRSVRLERGPDGRRDVSAYDGSMLRPGHHLSGPALVDGRDTTIWVPKGMTAYVNPQGTLVMEAV